MLLSSHLTRAVWVAGATAPGSISVFSESDILVSREDLPVIPIPSALKD